MLQPRSVETEKSEKKLKMHCVNMNNSENNVKNNPLPLVRAKINNKNVVGLIDCGSNITVIHAKFKNDGFDYKKTERCKIRVFNQENFENIGSISLNINFGLTNANIKNAPLITDLSYDFIVGTDFIKSIAFVKHQGKIQNLILNGFQMNVIDNYTTVFLTDEVVIPGNSTIFAKVHTKTPIKAGTVLIEGIPVENFELGEICDTFCHSSNLAIQIINLNSRDFIFQKNAPIGQITNSGETINSLIVADSPESEQKRHEKFLKNREKIFEIKYIPDVKLDPNLTSREQELIKKILQNNYQSFAYDDHDIGLVKGFRYGIRLTPEAKIWYEPQRRISPSKFSEVQNIFKKEIKYGLLEECSSEYNHALVLVRKPNGTLRVCSDLRKANENIICEKYPLPAIDGLLARLGEQIADGKKGDKIYMASFDILQAYRALEIAEGDKAKSAFSFGSKMYRHNRLGFGYKDAPATFSFLMQKVLKDIDGAYSFLDDVVIICYGLESFTKILDKLFKTLLNFGILLRPEKCNIGITKLDFLGHTITPEGIKIQEKKIMAVRKMNFPSNRDELRSVLGFFNFHLASVPNLYLTLEPLFAINKSKSRFFFGEKERQAFQKAKSDLENAQLRNHRDKSCPLVLSVDASDVGCGGVLYQVKNNKLEPLYYYSKCFSDVEKRLPIRSRELAAISYSVKNWQSYLICEEFTIFTDHKSLQYLQSTKVDALSVRQRNILFFLSHFRFKIHHISGSSELNKIADCLSRACAFKGLELDSVDPFDPDHGFWEIHNMQINNKNDNEWLSFFSEIFSIVEFKKDQLSDLNIKKKIENLKCDTNGSIVICKKDGRIPIPEKHAFDIISYVHVKKGHLGINKLYEYLSQFFKIRNISEKCTNVVKSCEDCLACKQWPKLIGDKQKKPHIVHGPFLKVFVDLIDLGGASLQGNRYGLSYCCALTRYCDIIPIKDKKSSTVSQALITLVLRYGIPNQIVSDHGAEFIYDTNDLLKDIFGIYVSRISPLNPRANLVERVHKNIKTLLEIYKVQLESWDLWMPVILFCYNSTAHSALPFQLTPFEALYLRPTRDILNFGKTEKISKKWLKKYPELEIFQKIAQFQKGSFIDNEHLTVKRPKILKAGQKVLIFKKMRKGQCKKLTRTWIGPYVIKRKTSPSVYELYNPITTQRLIRHIRYIRHYLPLEKEETVSQDNPLDSVQEESLLDLDVGQQMEGRQESNVPPPPISPNSTPDPLAPNTSDTTIETEKTGTPEITLRGRKIKRPRRFDIYDINNFRISQYEVFDPF